MPTRRPNLPDYETPPVIEVAFGVLYAEEIGGFTMAHAGRFWASLGPEYTRVRDAPPLQSVEETKDGTTGRLQISVNLPPNRRIQVLHKDSGWIVQVQPDRLLVNWSQEGIAAPYPRFETCLKQFQERRRQFERFCKESGLNVPHAIQYELTYVNHIPQGSGWNVAADLGSVFPDISWRRQREYLPAPKALSWAAVFDMPGDAGRLHVSVKTARKKSDNSEVLLSELTARSFRPAAGAKTSDEEWFQLARAWIVRGFADLTDNDMQSNVWGRIV